jgi:hypothetical protein
MQTTALVTQPDAINLGITNQSTPLEILTLQAEMKTIHNDFDLQEAVTNIGVHRIIDCVKEKYVKNSMNSTLGMPTAPSNLCSTIYTQTGAKS